MIASKLKCGAGILLGVSVDEKFQELAVVENRSRDRVTHIFDADFRLDPDTASALRENAQRHYTSTARMETDAKKNSDFVIEPIAALEGHTDRVWDVTWNPVQSLLASCSGDRSIRLWSYQSTLPFSSSPPAVSNPPADVTFASANELTTGHRKTVRSVAWAPSGKTLAAGSFDSTVSIWERAGGEEGENDSGEWECVTTLEGHESECKSVAYSSDGGLLASCSRDKSVWIWEGEFVILSILRPFSIICIALSHMMLYGEHCPVIQGWQGLTSRCLLRR